MANIIGCLDRPTSGHYVLEGRNLTTLNNDDLAYIRNRRIGFVFQQFNLLARSTALENVMLPMVYAGVPKSQSRHHDRHRDARTGCRRANSPHHSCQRWFK